MKGRQKEGERVSTERKKREKDEKGRERKGGEGNEKGGGEREEGSTEKERDTYQLLLDPLGLPVQLYVVLLPQAAPTRGRGGA